MKNISSKKRIQFSKLKSVIENETFITIMDYFSPVIFLLFLLLCVLFISKHFSTNYVSYQLIDMKIIKHNDTNISAILHIKNIKGEDYYKFDYLQGDSCLWNWADGNVIILKESGGKNKTLRIPLLTESNDLYLYESCDGEIINKEIFEHLYNSNWHSTTHTICVYTIQVGDKIYKVPTKLSFDNEIGDNITFESYRDEHNQIVNRFVGEQW